MRGGKSPHWTCGKISYFDYPKTTHISEFLQNSVDFESKLVCYWHNSLHNKGYFSFVRVNQSTYPTPTFPWDSLEWVECEGCVGYAGYADCREPCLSADKSYPFSTAHSRYYTVISMISYLMQSQQTPHSERAMGCLLWVQNLCALSDNVTL